MNTVDMRAVVKVIDNETAKELYRLTTLSEYVVKTKVPNPIYHRLGWL